MCARSVPEAASIAIPVGVIGLGAMGGPIARHLLAAGHPVTTYDLDAGALRESGYHGARVARSASEVAAVSQVVLVIVPTDTDTVETCLGESGIMVGARPETAVLLCSSLTPDTCATIAHSATEGVGVLDAALTGGVRGAEAGKINLLVGGASDVLALARPALSPWCASVHLLGPLGAGQVGKTVNNLIHWAEVVAVTEALSLGAAYGLDVPTLRAALQEGPVDSRTLHELEQMRFTWHAKDMANAEVMAREVDVSLPMAATARDVMTRTTVEGVRTLLARRATTSGALTTDDHRER